MIDWQEIEALGTEAEQLATMAQTVEDAIAYGPFTEKTYHGALSLLTALIHQHAQKINVVLHAELNELKSKKKERPSMVRDTAAASQ